ncbi:hypothetical protein ACH9D2_04125 [Kocuria sp. M4R2S49]
MGHPLHRTLPDAQPFVDVERAFDHPAAEAFRVHADPGLLAARAR